VHQGRGVDVVTQQRIIEHALGDSFGRFVAERILAVLLQRLAQAVQNLAERALAGAVAEETVVILQFDIKAIHVHRRQAGSTVPADAGGGGQCVLSHFTPAGCRNAGTTNGEPVGFMRGEWRVASGE